MYLYGREPVSVGLIPSFFYDRTILSAELTKTKAIVIGITTIITAKNTLLKNALNEGVITLNNLF
jgi:hypothetical protein